MNWVHSKSWDRVFPLLTFGALAIPLVALAFLFGTVVVEGIARLDWDFVTSFPSRKAALAGVWPALIGSFSLMVITGLIAVPVGVGAAIYLEEYGKQSRVAQLIETNINNLAGVPSIIYGLLGLGVFVRFFGMGRSLLAGGATLALLVMPIVIVVARESIRAVPRDLREAATALGASRVSVILRVVLPHALPGILTGTILALSRAVGETAPLVVVGAVAYVTFLPDGPLSEFTALPIQIFNWVSRPQSSFAVNAAAGIVVLLGLMLALNSMAIWLRHRLERRHQVRR
jgi:phosphate transport system permease protein